MATLVPPPTKKQKLAHATKAREQAELDVIPDGLGSIRVQFHDAATGKATGAPVAIPVADANVRNLEGVINVLLGNTDGEHVPYTFVYRRDAATAKSIDITNDLYHTLLQPDHATIEDTIALHYTPQAVFRVRAVDRCASTIPGHGESILCTQFSPATSARMASGSGDNTARIWDTDTGTPLHTLKGHTSWVLVVAWSPDGSVLATGSMDNSVRLWDPGSGQARGGPLKGHSKWIRAIAWEPYHLQGAAEGARLASASKDGTVRIWIAANGRTEHVLGGHKGSVSCVRWGGTGRLYSSSVDKMVKIWDAGKGTLLATLAAHAHWVNHLALSTDFALRTAYHDHTGEAPGGEAAKRAKAKERFETAARVDGAVVERLVSASDDFTVYLWQPPARFSDAKLKPLARLLGHQKTVNHVVFSPDGRFIASSAFDNHVKLWRAADGQFLFSLRAHVGPVYMSCFSADSRLLVSASKDTTLKVWDVRTGKMKEDLVGHKDQVLAVDWAPDGRRVGSGGADKAVRIWRH